MSAVRSNARLLIWHTLLQGIPKIQDFNESFFRKRSFILLISTFCILSFLVPYKSYVLKHLFSKSAKFCEFIQNLAKYCSLGSVLPRRRTSATTPRPGSAGTRFTGIVSDVSTKYFLQIWSVAQAVMKLRPDFIAGLPAASSLLIIYMYTGWPVKHGGVFLVPGILCTLDK